MKTLIISSSLNPDSHSHILCKEIESKLSTKQEIEINFLDLRKFDLKLTHQGKTDTMKEIEHLCVSADNYIFGMGVHCYSISDSLKTFLDNFFATGNSLKLFGIACTAGSDKSFLASQHLVQVMMNEFKLMPFPRIIFGSHKDFDNGKLVCENVHRRIDQFVNDFLQVGQKLLT